MTEHDYLLATDLGKARAALAAISTMSHDTEHSFAVGLVEALIGQLIKKIGPLVEGNGTKWGDGG